MQVYSITPLREIKEEESLSQALGLSEKMRAFSGETSDTYVISVVGAGGKTNTVFTLAGEQGAEGKRAVVTTTTHMMRDMEHGILIREGHFLPDTLPWEEHPYLAVTAELRKEGAPPNKTKGLSDRDLKKLERQSDVVIIEADGARKRGFKVPGIHEPVIPKETRMILIVMGLTALHRPLEECAFRLPELCRILNCDGDTILTESLAAQALYIGYWKPLSEEYPHAELYLVCNQADDENLRDSGREVAENLRCYVDRDDIQEEGAEKQERSHTYLDKGEESVGVNVPCILTTREPLERV